MVEQARILNPPRRVRQKARGAAAISRGGFLIDHRQATWLLRASLAGVFFWFGMLKVAGSSPVVDLLKGSYAFLASAPYLQLLGAGEIAIGLGLLVPRLSRLAAALMVMHLACTLGLVVVSPSLVFAPSFPVLTMQGEFLAKNLVFISAGLTLLVKKDR